jgi:NADH-ubiquinone oxidoreductase chain 1
MIALLLIKMIQVTLFLVVVVCVLIGVAFFNLFELKLQGYIQLRKRLNKVGIGGILQPFSDAIKLFSKEYISPSTSNYSAFLIAPCFSLGLSLLIWLRIPSFLIYFLLIRVSFFSCVG